MKEFAAETFGKWILAGEHAVLRGSPALVFPLKSCSIQMRFDPNGQNKGDRFDLQLSGPHGEEIQLLFWGVLEHALKQLHVDQSRLQGQFSIHSSLPVGTGLGASAALCVLVGRWCAKQGWIKEEDLYEFCRSLENLFHGESSGVDIAVALSGKGLRFLRSGERRSIDLKWWPQWYVSYSGRRGVTSECVNQVKNLFHADPELAERTDRDMRQAVAQAEEALRKTSAEGFELLQSAFEQAHRCFVNWGLTRGELGHHLKQLKEAGAAAAKPTGSGGGGYALSLWRNAPPAGLKGLIPLSPPN